MPWCLSRLNALTVVNCMLTLGNMQSLTTGSTFANYVQKFFGLPKPVLEYQGNDNVVLSYGDLM